MKKLLTLLLLALPQMALADTITLHAGLKTTLRHTYKTAAGVAQSIAGFEIHGAIRKTRDGAVILELSTEGVGPAIAIIESGATNTGVFDVTITGASTEDLAPGYYLLGYTYREEGETEYSYFGEVGIDLVQPVDEGSPTPTPTATP